MNMQVNMHTDTRSSTRHLAYINKNVIPTANVEYKKGRYPMQKSAMVMNNICKLSGYNSILTRIYQ